MQCGSRPEAARLDDLPDEAMPELRPAGSPPGPCRASDSRGLVRQRPGTTL